MLVAFSILYVYKFVWVAAVSPIQIVHAAAEPTPTPTATPTATASPTPVPTPVTPTPLPFYNEKVSLDVVRAVAEKENLEQSVTFKDVPEGALFEKINQASN
ncbi:hypothetical protein AB4Z50_34025 [Paenibacillus sp. 2TAB26]|uniref:hypothetical protein n=1 Tax=Paenibacillus sp. 2TAB26 TaxID=3233005 RepID=UPI003F9AE4BD